MQKQEFLNLLEEELKRLEEIEHISDLANNGKYEEVDAIIAKIDYSSLNEYMQSKDKEDLDIDDIPNEYVFTFAIYLSGSKYDEVDVMNEWEALRDSLLECGDIGSKMAAAMSNSYCLNEFDTFEELVDEEKRQ